MANHTMVPCTSKGETELKPTISFNKVQKKIKNYSDDNLLLHYLRFKRRKKKKKQQLVQNLTRYMFCNMASLHCSHKKKMREKIQD